MGELTEEEAFEMAGDAECPVLGKEESEALEAAVCLKRFPQGFLLGASDSRVDLKLWFTEDLQVAERWYRDFVTRLRESGTPFQ